MNIILRLLLFVTLLAAVLPSHAATVTVITPTRTSLTNNMLTMGTNGYVLLSTGIRVTNLTDLVGIGSITVSNLFATNNIFLQGTNITNFITGTLQVFSGFYGGGLPIDVPTTTAAIAYDLDPPGTEYLWDGSIWY